jgi:mannose-6-phosphate isomerase-like protein (cupin superfamily)
MRFMLLSVVLFAAGVFVGAQSTAAGTVYVDAAKVAAAIAKGGNLVSASDLTVLGAHRDAAGQVEVHDKETDVIYMIEGDATFVTGGKMVGGRQSRPNQWIGSDITGGESRTLHKGDIIVVPAGTPHWFKQVPKSVNYLVVKALKP